MKARVRVFPRAEILDPQGKAIGDALSRLGFQGVEEVRAGKSFDIDLGPVDRDQALRQAEEMCQKLLANPIIEDYAVEIVESAS